MFDDESLPEDQSGEEVVNAVSGDAPSENIRGGRVLIDRLQRRSRASSRARAAMLETVGELVARYEERFGFEWAADMAEAELVAALHLTRRSARTLIALACDVTLRLPQLLVMLKTGELDEPRVKVIIRETQDLSLVHAHQICSKVLGKAPRLTTSEIRAWIRRLRIENDTDEAKSRFDQAVTDRGVFCELTDEGTSTITATGLQPDHAAVVMDRITSIAHSLKNPTDGRTADQLRSDTFIDILWGTQPSGRKGVVDIRTDLTTLMNLDDNPVHLSGYGAVIADIGRQVATRGIQEKNGEWRFTITDGRGRSVTGLTRRRPTASDRRIVQARDVTCAFPGCRVPSLNCDLDHRKLWSEGGLTRPDQLVPLCRKDHVIRHRGWEHTDNKDGTHTWTSPLDVTYTTTRAP